MQQNLTYWTNSTLSGKPVYDATQRRWKVTVQRGEDVVNLEPAHIIMATGVLGAPYIPSFENRDQFPGAVFHSVEYKNSSSFAGKRVVVVGAGNTSIDVCKDLVHAKAESVTMVQRSATCVASRDNTTRRANAVWEPGVDVAVGDLKTASTPLGFIKQRSIQHQAEQWALERELHAKLANTGFKLTLGPEGAGQYLLVWERFGGTWCIRM